MAHSHRLPLIYSKSTSHCTKRRGFFRRYKGPWHCTYAKTSDSASLYRASWFARSLSNGGRGGGSWLPNAWSPEAYLIAWRCCATSCLRFLPAGVSQRLDRNVEARPLYSWNSETSYYWSATRMPCPPLISSQVSVTETLAFSAGTALHASDAIVGARMSPAKLPHESPFQLPVRLPRPKRSTY